MWHLLKRWPWRGGYHRSVEEDRVSNSCWGIFRESTHSPGRESDDTEILRLTGKHLEAKGFQVKLKTADEVHEIDDARPRFVFLMCERVEVLHRLRALEAGGGPHREPPWFRWFYHKDQQLVGHPLDPRQLARLVRRAATALGLEVYGGDAIATATGELVLLDVNAWPSFALYRDEASAGIAAYLALRFAGGRR